MNFSDDDLKRLKDKLASGPGEIVMLIVSAYELQALIARLEAAERVCERAKNSEYSWWPEIAAWLKKAGK